MNRQERIRLDTKTLKDMGFKRIKFQGLYDYFNDISIATTKYTVKKGKTRFTQYLFNEDINPDIIWEQIKKELEYDVLSVHTDFNNNGIIYNTLVEKDNIKSILLINYIPSTGEVITKEAEFNETDS